MVTRVPFLAGERNNMLVAVSPTSRRIGTNAVWLFLCDCGASKEALPRNVRQGNTKSCGCVPHPSVKTGLSDTKEYRAWNGMVRRCNDTKFIGYPNYGGRGISVCASWLKFENFLHDMGRRPSGMTLERKDSDGNYELSNCVWATPAEQSRNTRRNLLITIGGKTMCLKDWRLEMGLSYKTVQMRVQRGATPMVALLGDSA